LAKREFRPLTEEEALSRDYAELENLDKGAPIAFADYTVINDGTLDELHQALNKFL
jgi:dephospho-CoA kinase